MAALLQAKLDMIDLILKAKALYKMLQQKLADLYGEEDIENDMKNQLAELHSQHKEKTVKYRRLERKVCVFQKYRDTFGPDYASELKMLIKVSTKHFKDQKLLDRQACQSAVVTRRHQVQDAGRALEPPYDTSQQQEEVSTTALPNSL